MAKHVLEQGVTTIIYRIPFISCSVVGGFGKKIQKFSHQLIEADLTHFIASDAHNVSSRGSKMKEASELIEKKFGKSVLEMFHANAQSIVNGTYIETHTPQLIRKKKFLRAILIEQLGFRLI